MEEFLFTSTFSLVSIVSAFMYVKLAKKFKLSPLYGASIAFILAIVLFQAYAVAIMLWDVGSVNGYISAMQDRRPILLSLGLSFIAAGYVFYALSKGKNHVAQSGI